MFNSLPFLSAMRVLEKPKKSDTEEKYNNLKSVVKEYLKELDNNVAPDYLYRKTLRDRLKKMV